MICAPRLQGSPAAGLRAIDARPKRTRPRTLSRTVTQDRSAVMRGPRTVGFVRRISADRDGTGADEQFRARPPAAPENSPRSPRASLYDAGLLIDFITSLNATRRPTAGRDVGGWKGPASCPSATLLCHHHPPGGFGEDPGRCSATPDRVPKRSLPGQRFTTRLADGDDADGTLRSACDRRRRSSAYLSVGATFPNGTPT